MKINRIAIVLLSLAMVIGLAACQSQPSAPPAGSQAPAASPSGPEAPAAPASPDFPGGKPITFIVPWGAGGANDLGARVLQPFLEKELGTTVNIVNKPGSDGWLGYLEVINMKPDGYTISACNAFMNLLRHNPSSPHEEGIDDFELLACQVQDINALVCRADETRWSDFDSLIEYAKANEVTASINAFGSEDWLVLATLNLELGTQFVPIVDADGSAQSLANVLGGHVDLMSNNASTFYGNVSDGSLKALVSFGLERSAFFPDVPTYKELTGSSFTASSSRGIMMPKGGDPEVVKIIKEALERALTNPEQIAQLKEIGLEGAYLNAEDFKEMFYANEEAGRAVNDLLKFNFD